MPTETRLLAFESWMEAGGAQRQLAETPARPMPPCSARAVLITWKNLPGGVCSLDSDREAAIPDLTECELIIAEGFVSGRRINDIASSRGVSIETVRSQTKRMFERLKVSSQAEAAARLSRAAPFRIKPATEAGAAEAGA